MSPDDRIAAAERLIHEAIADPSASFWLRDAAKAAIARDPVDAVNDADILLGLLQPWAAAIFDAQIECFAAQAKPNGFAEEQEFTRHRALIRTLIHRVDDIRRTTDVELKVSFDQHHSRALAADDVDQILPGLGDELTTLLTQFPVLGRFAIYAILPRLGRTPKDAIAAAERPIQEVIADLAASYWLRDAAKAAIARDPVDAVNDADVLLGLLQPWAAAIVEAEMARAAEPALPFANDPD
jgi:hypothetical protein